MASHIPPLLNQFLEMMVLERKATRSTLSAYEADLRDFYNFFKNKAVEQLAAQEIQAYLLAQTHLAKATRARRLSSLRQFYAFLVKCRKISENPLSCMRIDSYKAKPVAKENIKRFLGDVKKDNSAKGKRLALLLHMHVHSEIPIDCIVSLPLEVGLKTLNERNLTLNDLTFPITKEVFEAMREYIEIRTKFLSPHQESPWLFPSASRKGHLTRQRFGQLLKELSGKTL